MLEIMEKNVLDDIMGDPEDFKELVDPDEDGERWEDTIREAEEAKEVEEMKETCTKPGTGPRLVHGTRYFVIKSLNHHHLVKAVEKGMWSTQGANDSVLNNAFETSERVLLVFSVNVNGRFQGYAQMTSSVSRPKAGESSRGGVFSVNWLSLHDLPFQETNHLKNPLDDFKPVKISRDCQELPEDVGEALCGLIDAVGGKTKLTSGTKRLRGDNVDSRRGKSPDVARGREKETERNRDREKRREDDREIAEGRDHRKTRRHSKAEPQEDFLNMTYEEYLRRHNLAYQQFAPVPPFAGPWMGMPDPYTMSNMYDRGRPELFYSGMPFSSAPPHGVTRRHDPKWRNYRS